jgi:hypothetical protein
MTKMNREDIIRMAEEAGAIHYWHLSNLERFAALVASAEREACAKVCDEFNFGQAPMMIQKAIRARGDKHD